MSHCCNLAGRYRRLGPQGRIAQRQMKSSLEIPKVELHCHLLGVISPALLERIERRGGQILVEPAALKEIYPVRDLISFRRWIDLLKPYQFCKPRFMRPILEAHIDSLVSQNVVYAEVIISPAMFPPDTADFVAAVRCWREWAYEIENGRIQVEFIMAVPRTLAPEELKRDTKAFLALRAEKLIAGVALVGVECGESLERFRFSFSEWRDAGLGIEVHAGEHSGPDSIWDALENAFPHRLGHALSAFQDIVLLRYIQSNNLHIEFCPSSNIATRAVSAIGEHPISRARGLGIGFSVNTDDPGAFNCSLASEYDTLINEFAFGIEDFTNIFENSLRARFEPKLRFVTLPF
jgi:aminodeoxyfutalosine deaminase